MNTWLKLLNAQLPAFLAVLALVTALLIAGLAVQQVIRRSSAARHAVLLWTLIAVGLCPILIAAVRLAAIPAPLVMRPLAKPFNVLFGNPGAAQALQTGSQPATA